MANTPPDQRTLIASHQLPYVMTLLSNGSWLFASRFGHTALYAGINALARSSSVLHIGWTGLLLDESGQEISTSLLTEQQVDSLKQELFSRNCIAVMPTRQESLGHYEGYCKTDLWNLFHYILWQEATNGITEVKNWTSYKRVNKLFAETIASVHKQGDLVWIHDYHLMLVPEELRAILPTAAIGFFLHTPFPSSEIFRCLPSYPLSYLIVVELTGRAQ